MPLLLLSATTPLMLGASALAAARRRDLWQVPADERHVIELDSSREGKFSRHVVIRLPGAALASNAVARGFVQHRLLQRGVQEAFQVGGSDGAAATSIIDTSVYSRRASASAHVRDRTRREGVAACGVAAFGTCCGRQRCCTQGDGPVQHLQRCTSFNTPSAVRRNRQFRCLFSSKFDSSVKLQPSRRMRSGRFWPAFCRLPPYEQWRLSLVSFVALQDQLLDLDRGLLGGTSRPTPVGGDNLACRARRPGAALVTVAPVRTHASTCSWGSLQCFSVATPAVVWPKPHAESAHASVRFRCVLRFGHSVGPTCAAGVHSRRTHPYCVRRVTGARRGSKSSSG